MISDALWQRLFARDAGVLFIVNLLAISLISTTMKGILLAGREQLTSEPEITLQAPAHLHGPETLFAHLEA